MSLVQACQVRSGTLPQDTNRSADNRLRSRRRFSLKVPAEATTGDGRHFPVGRSLFGKPRVHQPRRRTVRRDALHPIRLSAVTGEPVRLRHRLGWLPRRERDQVSRRAARTLCGVRCVPCWRIEIAFDSFRIRLWRTREPSVNVLYQRHDSLSIGFAWLSFNWFPARLRWARAATSAR